MTIFVNVPIRTFFFFFFFFLLTLLKIRNILCKAGFKMCQAAHVGLVGTEGMVGIETFRGPWGPSTSIYEAQTTQRRCGGLWATSVPSLCPVAIVVFVLGETDESVLRRRRRRRRRMRRLNSKRRISMPCFTGIDNVRKVNKYIAKLNFAEIIVS